MERLDVKDVGGLFLVEVEEDEVARVTSKVDSCGCVGGREDGGGT